MLEELFAPVAKSRMHPVGDAADPEYEICALMEFPGVTESDFIPCVIYGACSESPDVLAWMDQHSILGFQGETLIVAFNEHDDSEEEGRSPAASSVGCGSGQGQCFLGESRMRLADGSESRVDQIQPGQMVFTLGHAAARVVCVVRGRCVGEQMLINLSDTLAITPHHPIRVDPYGRPISGMRALELEDESEGSWQFPWNAVSYTHLTLPTTPYV